VCVFLWRSVSPAFGGVRACAPCEVKFCDDDDDADLDDDV